AGCPPSSQLRPPSRRSQPRRAVAKPPPFLHHKIHPVLARVYQQHIALLHCRKRLFAIVRIKNLDRLPLAVRGETCVHFVDHCVDSVPVISIDPQVRARRSEKREEANVAAQVGSQLQKASESTEADDLVLAWIESIHANDRLLSFVAALASLPARPPCQP